MQKKHNFFVIAKWENKNRSTFTSQPILSKNMKNKY